MVMRVHLLRKRTGVARIDGGADRASFTYAAVVLHTRRVLLEKKEEAWPTADPEDLMIQQPAANNNASATRKIRYTSFWSQSGHE